LIVRMLARLKQLPATAWVTFQHATEQALWLLLFVIQAPILGPKAFGLISLIMVFVGFCEFVVASVGTELLLSIRDIQPRHYSTVTVTCVAISAVLGGALFFAADALARIFQDAELPNVARALAFLPILSCLSAAPSAAVKRAMNFRGTALRGISSVSVAGSVSLGLTLSGAGVWALVVQALLQRLVSVVVLWQIATVRPSAQWSWPCLKSLGPMAGKLTVSSVMSWSSGQLPRLILGWWLGIVDLGLFALASRLIDLLTQIAIWPKITVARVYLRTLTDDLPALRAAAEKMFGQLSLLCFPLCAGGALVIPPLFHFWLDPRWYGAIAPSQWLLLTGIPSVTFYCSAAVLLAVNRQGTEALVESTQTLSSAAVAAAVGPLGFLPVTAALALRPWLLVLLPIVCMVRTAHLTWSNIVGPQLRPLLAAAAMGACIWALRLGLEDRLPGAWLIALLIVTGVLVYAALSSLLMPDLLRQLIRRDVRFAR